MSQNEFISAEALLILQRGVQALQDAQPRLTEREFARSLTDLMVRLLHYQDQGEPPWDKMALDEWQREVGELPRAMVDRYRNDSWFHMQVERAVAAVLNLVDRRESDYAR